MCASLFRFLFSFLQIKFFTLLGMWPPTAVVCTRGYPYQKKKRSYLLVLVQKLQANHWLDYVSCSLLGLIITFFSNEKLLAQVGHMLISGAYDLKIKQLHYLFHPANRGGSTGGVLEELSYELRQLLYYSWMSM